MDRSKTMTEAQVLTTSYAQISEATVQPNDGDDVIRFTVSNEGATNALDAKIMGRHQRSASDKSDWVDVTAAISVAATANGLLAAEAGTYDEFAVFAKSASGTSAKAWGASRRLRRVTPEDRLLVSRSIGAEAGDAITTSLALSKIDAASVVHVTGYTGIQAAAGDLVEALDAALTLSDGTNGSTLSGDDTHAALFQTTAGGLLDIVATDVAGASSLEFILVVRKGSALGELLDIFVLSFDGA